MIRLAFLQLLLCTVLQTTFAQTPADSAKFKIQAPTDTIKPKTQQLNGVTIKATRPLIEQSQYGTTVNVESSILTKGSTVLSTLERAPGVVLDHRNNVLSLNGKKGVKVMINGRLMPLNNDQVLSLLSGMSADNIGKIELMPTPPAQYDAEGSAGLINIILKKNRRAGTNGNASLMAGFGRGEKAGASINLGHNTGKINWYGNYAYNHDRSYGKFNGYGNDIVPPFGYTVFDFLGRMKPVYNNHNATLGMDANINTRLAAGASINYNHASNTSLSINTGNYTIGEDSLLQLKATVRNIGHWNNMNASLYLENKIREGEQWNINMDYLYYNNNSPAEVISSFLNNKGQDAGDGNQYAPRQRGISNTNIGVGVIKMDYSLQLSKKIKWESGVKGTYTNSSSSSGIQSMVNGTWVNRDGTTNIEMKESIGAAYTSFNIQLDSATSITAGSRYEYAYTHLDDLQTGKNTTERKLGIWFPSIFATRQLSTDASLQLSFTKRISRPSYNDLSSIIQYNDPFSVFTGNPLLKPTITTNLKLGYNYHDYTFSVLLSNDKNPIVNGQLMTGPESGVVYISPQNLTYLRSLTFEAGLPSKIGTWWSMRYNINAGWQTLKMDYTVEPIRKTYFTYSINGTETFMLPKAYSLELSGRYNAPGYYGTMRNYSYASISAGIKKELPGNKGSFQLTVADPVRIVQMKTGLGALGKDAFATDAIVINNPESTLAPVIKLTYTRSLGNGISKARKKHDNSASEENQRLRKD